MTVVGLVLAVKTDIPQYPYPLMLLLGKDCPPFVLEQQIRHRRLSSNTHLGKDCILSVRAHTQ